MGVITYVWRLLLSDLGIKGLRNKILAAIFPNQMTGSEIQGL